MSEPHRAPEDMSPTELESRWQRLRSDLRALLENDPAFHNRIVYELQGVETDSVRVTAPALPGAS